MLILHKVMNTLLHNVVIREQREQIYIVHALNSLCAIGTIKHITILASILPKINTSASNTCMLKMKKAYERITHVEKISMDIILPRCKHR